MHERLSVHSICFAGAKLRELAGYWLELGARRVSLSSAQLLDEELSVVRELLAGGDHALETVTHPFLSGRPLEPDEKSWRTARAALMRLIDAAAELGARSIYMLTGGHGGQTWERDAETFAAAIAPCVAHARDAGVALMIENAPWLYADLHIAHSLRDTVTQPSTHRLLPRIQVVLGTPANNPTLEKLVASGLELGRENLGDEGFQLRTWEQGDDRYLIVYGLTQRALKHACQELLFYQVQADAQHVAGSRRPSTSPANRPCGTGAFICCPAGRRMIPSNPGNGSCGSTQN